MMAHLRPSVSLLCGALSLWRRVAQSEYHRTFVEWRHFPDELFRERSRYRSCTCSDDQRCPLRSGYLFPQPVLVFSAQSAFSRNAFCSSIAFRTCRFASSASQNISDLTNGNRRFDRGAHFFQASDIRVIFCVNWFVRRDTSWLPVLGSKGQTVLLYWSLTTKIIKVKQLSRSLLSWAILWNQPSISSQWLLQLVCLPLPWRLPRDWQCQLTPETIRTFPPFSRNPSSMKDANFCIYSSIAWMRYTSIHFHILHQLTGAHWNQTLASPAPWKRYLWSDSFVWQICMEAITPATATDAVPVQQSRRKQ